MAKKFNNWKEALKSMDKDIQDGVDELESFTKDFHIHNERCRKEAKKRSK